MNEVARKKNLEFVVIAILSGILVWWWVQRYLEQQARERPGEPLIERRSDRVLVLQGGMPRKAEGQKVAAPAPKTAPVRPDDLKKIEGIGPKIAGVLQAVGILTYAQLAATEADALQQILTEANLRLANPATWPQQACLAAAGDWDGLAALQNELKGGRRVS